eukprot:3678240-Amphidinium_carterae.2
MSMAKSWSNNNRCQQCLFRWWSGAEIWMLIGSPSVPKRSCDTSSFDCKDGVKGSSLVPLAISAKNNGFSQLRLFTVWRELLESAKRQRKSKPLVLKMMHQ